VEPRVSLVTLGVSDLERAVAFYQDGLGWPKSEVGSDEVAFFKTGGMVISLFPRTSFAADAGLWRCAVILDQLLLPTSGGACRRAFRSFYGTLCSKKAETSEGWSNFIDYRFRSRVGDPRLAAPRNLRPRGTPPAPRRRAPQAR
jgi:hypothetical protein